MYWGGGRDEKTSIKLAQSKQVEKDVIESKERFLVNIMKMEHRLLMGGRGPHVDGQEVAYTPGCSECVCILKCLQHKHFFSVLSS